MVASYTVKQPNKRELSGNPAEKTQFHAGSGGSTSSEK